MSSEDMESVTVGGYVERIRLLEDALVELERENTALRLEVEFLLAGGTDPNPDFCEECGY